MKKIGVLGTGTMGAGIIQVCAQKGYEVVMRARRETSIEKGLATVKKNLDKMVAKGKIEQAEADEIFGRVHGSTDINIIADADLVIEAATEDMEAKKALFAQLNEICKPDTIIATNTSSLSITEIAVASGRPDKVIGMHFFNPVPAMKLVEIICGLTTSEETKATILELTQILGKTPVEVAEAPGFVVNRILVPMINMARKGNKTWWAWAISAATLFMVAFMNFSPIYILLTLIVIAICVTLIKERRQGNG